MHQFVILRSKKLDRKHTRYELLVFRSRFGSFPNRGPQYRPQNPILLLIMETPKKGSPILETTIYLSPQTRLEGSLVLAHHPDKVFSYPYCWGGAKELGIFYINIIRGAKELRSLQNHGGVRDDDAYHPLGFRV